ncbi:DUF6906 family protein [Sutcliffiella horikoshii]|uniref:DUF6906 family protein n=1 Tax=Sutcliffiella horikoshii TaxID=79883 RepID=UPI0016534E05|nr:hypothetical protein [Sutcliffiella horikoshii]
MKHGKRPTKAQKILMVKNNLNPADWLIVKNLDHEMHVVNRFSSEIRVLFKEIQHV